jgi:hypothetical protein
MKLKIFVLAIFLCGTYYLARPYLEYASAIQEETIQRFQIAKRSFQKFGFKGVAVSKKICPKCLEDAAYQVSIDFVCSENCIKFPFPPRFDYEIENQNVLTMGVTKKIYEIIAIGDSITKPQNSNIIQINGSNYQLLSADSTKWLQ